MGFLCLGPMRMRSGTLACPRWHWLIWSQTESRADGRLDHLTHHRAEPQDNDRSSTDRFLRVSLSNVRTASEEACPTGEDGLTMRGESHLSTNRSQSPSPDSILDGGSQSRPVTGGPSRQERPESLFQNSAVGDSEETRVSPLMNIKDEPIDEGYDCALLPSTRNIKEELDNTAPEEELRISSVFSVGGGNAYGSPIGSTATSQTTTSSSYTFGPGRSVVPQGPTMTLRSLAPMPQPPQSQAPSSSNTANAVRVSCSGCSKILLRGQTAFQRKGSTQLFCSTVCLTGFTLPPVKLRTCYQCLKEIEDPKDVISVITDNNLKDFCSQFCLSVFNRRRKPGPSSILPSFHEPAAPKCSMCKKSDTDDLATTLERTDMDRVFKPTSFNRRIRKTQAAVEHEPEAILPKRKRIQPPAPRQTSVEIREKIDPSKITVTVIDEDLGHHHAAKLMEAHLDTIATLMEARIKSWKAENHDTHSLREEIMAVADALMKSNAALAESQASLAESQASLAESQASLAESQASLAESQASLAESQASLAESQASLAESQASLAESQAPLESNAVLAESRAPLESNAVLAKSRAPLESNAVLAKSRAPLESNDVLAETQAPLESNDVLVESQAPLAESQAKLVYQSMPGSPVRSGTPARGTAWRKIPPLTGTPTGRSNTNVAVTPRVHADIIIPPLTPENEALIIGSHGGRPDRYAVLLFKITVTEDLYHEWVRNTNWDGSRNKVALPLNLRVFILNAVSRKFPSMTMTAEIRKGIKNRINEYLRTPRLSGHGVHSMI
uniref:TRASH domain-containing protein n=1 Tax=Esox lucius TaxID=8010 RepID=A0AAY5KW15_ESOLU